MELIRLLENLIKIDTSNKKGIDHAIKYCNDWFIQRDMTPNIINNKGYKSLVYEIGAGSRRIVLNGHIDVVKGKKAQFEPFIQENRLYGRGSADMKAGVAAMMYVMYKLKSRLKNCTVQLQLVPDEEIGGEFGTKFLTQNKYLGDFVICGEPTQLQIGIQSKGILQIDVEVYGKSSHSSRPWEGDNAILKCYRIFNKIKQLPFPSKKSKYYDNSSVNLSKIKGGNEYNVVPDHCTMSLDIRFIPELDKEEVIKQIKDTCNCEAKVHVKAFGQPVNTSDNNKYVLDLKSAANNILADNIKVFGQHGSADTRFFSKYNIPAVEFGPVGSNWHGDNEYVEIDSIYSYIDILMNFIQNIK